jgi:diaminohydroxyphosphoribosylaminopyrimidine deaminase/5-amino-6-(5-phosphoribosylamino)uracil reductase
MGRAGKTSDRAAAWHDGADRAAAGPSAEPAASTAEIAGMRRALQLAARGLGTTSPNPIVGCVILDPFGEIVGEGFHEYRGGPHAEVRALGDAGPRAHGGTALVTLEPCAHTGLTGPCTEALIAAGVRRVVAAVSDPYRPASGGADILRRAGIDVEIGLLAGEAARLNEAWLTSVRLGRPHVTWKYAASLDGRVAAADGSSRWITSAAARVDVHRLRAEADAVVVGSGTLIADDPHLAARNSFLHNGQPSAESRRITDVPDQRAGPFRQPLRVVVDTEARIRPDARVLDASAPTLVAVAVDSDTGHLPAGVDVARLPRAAGRGLDLRALLAELYRRDVIAVLLEGGPTLAGSFLAASLIDKVVGYLAPVVVGGDGLPVLTGPGAPTIADVLRLRIDEVIPIGPDLRITARLRNEEELESPASGEQEE